eukprot:gene7198-7964_t
MEEELVQSLAFYEGHSVNPVHLVLNLPLSVIKMAHMAAGERVVALAQTDRLDEISITQTDNDKFKRLQIVGNLFLKRQGLPSLRIYQMTPRMLLPYQNTEAVEEAVEEVVEEVVEGVVDSSSYSSPGPAPSTEDSSSGSSRSEEKAKEVKETNTTSASMRWGGLSLSKDKVAALLDRLPSDCHAVVLEMCELYEAQLADLHETFDAITQSLNLKLYLANCEKERLQEEIQRLQPSSSLNHY